VFPCNWKGRYARSNTTGNRPNGRSCTRGGSAQERRLHPSWADLLWNQPRGTQCYRAIRREDEDALTQAIIQLASQYGRYGYRRITVLLKRAGWRVGKDRVERIWRREGLKVPQKQKPRGRLWLNDGSCVRLRPTHRNHVEDDTENMCQDARRRSDIIRESLRRHACRPIVYTTIYYRKHQHICTSAKAFIDF
jgi:hypothetical protein